MSGKEPEFELVTSNFKRVTLKPEARVADIQQTTNENSPGVSKVERRKKKEKSLSDIIEQLSGGTMSDNSAYDFSEAIEAIDAIKYEDLRKLYSSFKKDNFVSLFRKKSNVWNALKFWKGIRLTKKFRHYSRDGEKCTNQTRIDSKYRWPSQQSKKPGHEIEHPTGSTEPDRRPDYRCRWKSYQLVDESPVPTFI